MKNQNIKLAKKIIFVYKSVKDQNNFVTNPLTDQSQTMVTNATFAV